MGNITALSTIVLHVGCSLPTLLSMLPFSPCCPDVKKVTFDMEKQKVYVETSMSGEDILAIIKKTGRECSYVGVKQ